MGAFSFAALRKHPSLVPLVVVVGAGMIMSGAYLARLALASPEVTWNRKTNPEPWNAYDKKQYKFYDAAGRNFKEIPDRPEF